MNQSEFFQKYAVDGVLPEDRMTEMLTLPVGGETSGTTAAGAAEPGSVTTTTTTTTNDGAQKDGATGTQATGTTTAQTPNEQDLNADNAVILARDGKHVIEFSKLEEARERAAAAEQARAAAEAQAQALQAEIAKLQGGATTTTQGTQTQQTTTQQTTTTAPAVDVDKLMEGVDFGDYSDAAIGRAVAAMTAKAVMTATAPLQAELATLRQQAGEIQQGTEQTAAEKHYAAIYAAHPDADSITESVEFKKWTDSLPAFQQRAIASTLAEGDTQDVIDVFSSYKTSTGKAGATTTTTAQAADDGAAARAAQAAIDKAATKTPASLTDLPAGTVAHHDPAEAMLEMSPTKAMAMFEGKDPKAIMDSLNRVL